MLYHCSLCAAVLEFRVHIDEPHLAHMHVRLTNLTCVHGAFVCTRARASTQACFHRHTYARTHMLTGGGGVLGVDDA